MASSETYSAHYISGTHWDREWYRTFQEFRLLFVDLVDGLLDLMEKNPAFKSFHFDGQTCVLQDYLEVRPENRDRLAALIGSGRILIGPWYTMPDLFCPGAEALVRNLLTGQRIASAWSTSAIGGLHLRHVWASFADAAEYTRAPALALASWVAAPTNTTPRHFSTGRVRMAARFCVLSCRIKWATALSTRPDRNSKEAMAAKRATNGPAKACRTTSSTKYPAAMAGYFA